MAALSAYFPTCFPTHFPTHFLHIFIVFYVQIIHIFQHILVLILHKNAQITNDNAQQFSPNFSITFQQFSPNFSITFPLHFALDHGEKVNRTIKKEYPRYVLGVPPVCLFGQLNRINAPNC